MNNNNINNNSGNVWRKRRQIYEGRKSRERVKEREKSRNTVSWGLALGAFYVL